MHRLLRLARVLACLAVSACLPAAAGVANGSPAGVVVYENDFRHKPGEEWSKRDTDVTPRGRRPFLGMFGGEQVGLSLDRLPAHRFLRVSFTLFMLNPVDGSSPVWGPDVWDLTVEGGPSLLHTTFDNCGFFSDNNEQAFPDEFPEAPGHPWPGWTGCDEKQTLGYLHSWGGPESTFGVDSVYSFNLALPHDAAAVRLLFTSYSTEDKNGEAWGIGRVRVEALSEPPAKPDEAQLEKWWDALAGSDPVKAFHAKWGLIAAGEAGRSFLRGRMDAPVDARRVRGLVLALRDGLPETRERATKNLIALGSPAVALLEKALEDEESPEAIGRLREVLAEINKGSADDPEALRRRRAGHALRVLSGEPARFTPEENGRKPVPAGP